MRTRCPTPTLRKKLLRTPYTRLVNILLSIGDIVTPPYLSPVPIPHPPPLSRLSLVTRFVPSLAQVAHSILSALAIYLNAAIGLMHVVITLANTTNIARLKMQIVDLIR